MSARRRLIAHVAFLILCLSFGPALAADSGTLRGDPFRGRELLAGKLCVQCHSVWGEGGELGPDIPTVVAGKSWLDLVGDFWNHTPGMIDAMAARGHAWPTMDQTEMADLLSYLYYLRLFDDPGDVTAGSIAWSRLQCAGCHTLGGTGGQGGGALDRFSAHPSPVVLAQAMWNAGPAMQRYQVGHGTPIPMFLGREMADIQAWIKSRAVRDEGEITLMALPDPDRGQKVYASKGCGSCHRAGAREAPDLAARVSHMTVSEISGALWNHSYAMNDRMRARGIPFPSFEGSEMADLISYLHFLSFLKETGDPSKGEAIAREKGCITCHERNDAAVRQLAGNPAAGEPVALAAAMWNHAPEMHRMMAEKSVAWPRFEHGEMANLAAWLRTFAVSPGAAGH